MPCKLAADLKTDTAVGTGYQGSFGHDVLIGLQFHYRKVLTFHIPVVNPP